MNWTMNWNDWLWVSAGALAGGFHAWLLWRAAQPPFDGVLWHIPRLLLTATVLVAAAFWGHLVPAFIGWGVAYFSAVNFVRLTVAR